MNKNDEEKSKKVDEAWKDAAFKEKAKGETKQKQESFPIEADFISFVSTLSMQALVGLGVLPNPLNNKKQEDLNQSRYIIDIIDMLKDKTKGNLSDEETKFIDNILYELRTKFVEKTK